MNTTLADGNSFPRTTLNEKQQEVLKNIVITQYPQLKSFLLSLSKTESDADDTLQDLMLNLSKLIIKKGLKALPEFDLYEEDINAWNNVMKRYLYAAAKNIHITKYHKDSKLVHKTFDFADYENTFSEFDYLANHHNHAQIMSTIKKLIGSRDYYIFLDHKVLKMSSQYVANQHGLSEANVRKICSRRSRQIRKELAHLLKRI